MIQSQYLKQAPARLPEARILRRPRTGKAGIGLTLCTPDALAKPTIARRNRDGYKRARKLGWGDPFQPLFLTELQQEEAVQ